MRKIEYLRVIVNNKCNLSCFFCHREGERCVDRLIDVDQTSLVKMINILVKCGIKKIKFLGGEPTLCRQLPDVISDLRLNKDLSISMITNGVVTKNVIDRFCDAGINKINISLHGYNGDVFESVTGGTKKQLCQTLDTIEHLNEKGILGKVNYVLLKGVNEEEFLDVLDYTAKQNIVLDVLNYLGTNAELIEKFYYSFEEITEIIRQRHSICNVYQYTNDFSLPSTRLTLEKGGTINLKTTKLNTVSFLNSCEACDKRDVCVEGIAAIRLTADGIVKPCIFRDDNTFDLLKCISENGETQAIEQLMKYLENL